MTLTFDPIFHVMQTVFVYRVRYPFRFSAVRKAAALSEVLNCLQWASMANVSLAMFLYKKTKVYFGAVTETFCSFDESFAKITALHSTCNFWQRNKCQVTRPREFSFREIQPEPAKKT